ncbi:hypothetical protein TREES_T100005011 [Tupaia chinensis]|uniref:Uncharacterized protein n=1 Tax=Tupaia chinensis TaxID=246437 RepID=L9L856_TUPCH|nr:hypothetical protein TREES_T100005011 [Tupaia chinensis]
MSVADPVTPLSAANVIIRKQPGHGSPNSEYCKGAPQMLPTGQQKTQQERLQLRFNNSEVYPSSERHIRAEQKAAP